MGRKSSIKGTPIEEHVYRALFVDRKSGREVARQFGLSSSSVNRYKTDCEKEHHRKDSGETTVESDSLIDYCTNAGEERTFKGIMEKLWEAGKTLEFVLQYPSVVNYVLQHDEKQLLNDLRVRRNRARQQAVHRERIAKWQDRYKGRDEGKDLEIMWATDPRVR